MQIFSAAQAVSPAIIRTRRFLFASFRWSAFLKLCAVAVLTEGFGGNFHFSFPGLHNSTAAPSISGAQSPFKLSSDASGWIALITAISVVAILVGMVIFYLITRLRFALFYCLVHDTSEIRPGWRLYRDQSNRFFVLSLVVGFIFLAVTTAALLPFILGFIRFFRARAPDDFNLPGFFSLLLPLIPVIILLVLAALATEIILRDLMLPHMALENATARQAWASVRSRIGDEKGSFLLFGILRVLLPLIAFVATLILLAIPALLVFGALAISIAGLDRLVSIAQGPNEVFLILIEAALVLVSLAAGTLIALSTAGPIGIAVRNYALLFYGSRYQVLGDLLDPPHAEM